MLERFEYKRATMEDIEELVRTRIIVLRAANKLSDDEDMSVVEEESYAYYGRALETGEHIAYLVYDNGKFIGAGGVSFYQYVYGIGISETGDCISYIRFTGKGCEETGHITDYFRGDRDGTTFV